MRRALVAVAIMSPMMVAAYACTTDSFTDGGTDGGGESGVTQSEFCDAEALYFHQCGFDEAGCAQTDLKSCGAMFTAFSDGLATALAHCMEMGQLPCTGDFTKVLTTPCVSSQLAGYQNDSGTLAAFANDYCNACDKGSACVGKFASASDQPGYLASLFSDGVIKPMDDCEKKLDGSTIVTSDASVSCLQQTLLCEYIALASTVPTSACSDH